MTFWRRRLAMMALAMTMAAPLWAALVASMASASTDHDLIVDRYGDHTPFMVVLDTSGSMNELAVAATAGRRLDEARSAIIGTVHGLEEGHLYGMVSYPGGPQNEGCETGQVRTRIGPLDHRAATVEVRKLSASGETPTGPALQQAAQLLEEAGHDRGTIVLVSDGESNCGTPPCEVATAITQAGFDVTVHTVGFSSLGVGKDELTCIAAATGGTYVEVDDEEGLSDALGQGVRAQLRAHVSLDSMVVLGGTSDPRINTLRVTVINEGSVDARDVRVSVQMSQRRSGLPGGAEVPRPVRYLGNLSAGESREVVMNPRPPSGGDWVWTVNVRAANGDTVTTTGSVTVRDSVERSDLGNVLGGARRVAILGDSYSSGEGTGRYEEGVLHDCHRSDAAYGPQIWDADAVLIACSGATTRDLRQTQVSGGEQITPQLRALRDAALGGESLDAVVLTVGGNDSGFGEFARKCVGDLLCGDYYLTGGAAVRQQMLERALGTQPAITQALKDIDAAVNDSEARQARRGGQVIPIIILEYPRIVPETGKSVAHCMIGIGNDETALLNEYLDALNSAVSLAAYQLRNEGRPVYPVHPTANAFQPNHTICDGAQSYAVTLSDLVIDPAIIMADGKDQLLHPNAAGHTALARDLVTWSNGDAAKAFPVRGTVHWDDNVISGPRGPLFRFFDSLTGMSSPGDEVPLQASGYAPGSTVHVWMNSTQLTLDTLRADDSGDIAAAIWIPTWAEAGDHTLSWAGPGPDGHLRVETKPLTLHPIGTTPWLLGGTAGGTLLILGLIFLVVDGRLGRKGSETIMTRPSTPAA